MDNITDIFDEETQTGSGDLDVDIATAGVVLTKLAEEVNVDLGSLSDAQIAELMADLMPPKTASQQTQQTQQTPTNETRKEASAMSQQTEPKTVSYAEVGIELTKIAAAKNIDLTKISEADYVASFNELADRMADPNYASATEAAKVAAAQEAEKIAADKAAFEHGERIADGFLARIKRAEDEESKKREDEEKAKAKKEEEAKKEASAASEIAGHGKAALGVAKDMVKKHMGAAADKGKHLVAAVKEHGAKHKGHYAAGAGGAAAGAAATGAAMSRKKEAALKIAQEIVEEMGFDPATGQPKVAAAAEETFTDEEVAAEAIEMLKAANYIPQE